VRIGASLLVFCEKEAYNVFVLETEESGFVLVAMVNLIVAKRKDFYCVLLFCVG